MKNQNDVFVDTIPTAMNEKAEKADQIKHSYILNFRATIRLKLRSTKWL